MNVPFLPDELRTLSPILPFRRQIGKNMFVRAPHIVHAGAHSTNGAIMKGANYERATRHNSHIH